jgi:hypothetical protein
VTSLASQKKGNQFESTAITMRLIAVLIRTVSIVVVAPFTTLSNTASALLPKYSSTNFKDHCTQTPLSRSFRDKNRKNFRSFILEGSARRESTSAINNMAEGIDEQRAKVSV